MSEPRFEIRQATPEDVPAFGPLWRSAFNAPQHAIESIPERIRPERLLVAIERDEVVASAQGFALDQWFGGRPLPTVGIASVAVQPRLRGTGVGTAVMERLLAKSRDEGRSVATLYPATVPVYRRLGFEYAGLYTKYRVPLAALPDGPRIEFLDVSDAGPIRATYLRLAERENGLTEGVDDDWWPWRVLGRWDREPIGAVMTGEEVPDGYAAYSQEESSEGWGYRISCAHLVALTRDAGLALLGYFKRFKGVGKELEWQGSPNEPLALLLPEQALAISWTFRNMSRILDVPSALESRGYPDVTGSATFAVDDPLFPDNSGPFLLDSHEGKVQVTRSPAGTGAAGGPISIGALSTMFTSYLTPQAAARVGLVDPEHPALELLGRLFAGPPPWTPDFF